MGSFKNAISSTLKGAVMSYQRYPSAMLSATALAVLTSIRIADNSLLTQGQFDRWQLILALVALISLAWSGWLYSRDNPRNSNLLSLASLLAIVPLFFMIQPVGNRIPALTSIRAVAVGAISVILFVLVISRNSEKTDFNKRFFMLHKAFFIALLYMLVVMGGLNFTAAAVEILLYSDMSSDVYQYLSTWSGFLGFAFFLGNLPNLKKSAPFDTVHASQKQPRFIEVLFTFVMIPILFALSFVLLIWALRMLITRSWPEFEQLASIFSGYILLGSWLMIMISDSGHGLAKFFRRVYPLLAILFLSVEATAIIRQINRYGIRGGEYAAAFIWLFGISAAVYFLIKPVKLNYLSAWTAAVLILISVLPLTGFSDVTLNSQLNRMNAALERNGMLQGDTIVPAEQDNLPDQEDQVLITEAASYLVSLERPDKLPDWFPQEDSIHQEFGQVFGFEQRWHYQDFEQPNRRSAMVRADNSTIDISEYDLLLTEGIDRAGLDTSFETNRGSYQVKLLNLDYGSAPSVVVSRDNAEVINYDLQPELDDIGQKAQESLSYELVLEPEDLQFSIEKDGIRILVVARTIDVNWDGDDISYILNLDGVYFSDEPAG